MTFVKSRYSNTFIMLRYTITDSNGMSGKQLATNLYMMEKLNSTHPELPDSLYLCISVQLYDTCYLITGSIL